jgi:hypothetical protein
MPVEAPDARWVGDALHVSVVVNETAGVLVSDEAPGALLLGSKLVLCYQVESASLSQGGNIPSWAGPVALEFVITDLPRTHYPDLEIRRGCHQLP